MVFVFPILKDERDSETTLTYIFTQRVFEGNREEGTIYACVMYLRHDPIALVHYDADHAGEEEVSRLSVFR